MFAFLSGHSLAETGHGCFARVLEHLHKAFAAGADRMTLIRALLDVEESLALHLGMEEVVLRALDYPDVVHHAWLHNRLLDQVSQVRERFDINRWQNPAMVSAAVEDLLCEHALREDAAYWDLLRGMDLTPAWLAEGEAGEGEEEAVSLATHHRALGKLITILGDESASDALFLSTLTCFRTLAAHHLRREAASPRAARPEDASSWLLWSLDEALSHSSAISRRAMVGYLSGWLATHHQAMPARAVIGL